MILKHDTKTAFVSTLSLLLTTVAVVRGDTVTTTNAGNWNAAIWSPASPASGDVVVLGHNVALTNSTPQLSALTNVVGTTLTFYGTNTALRATHVTIQGSVTHADNTDTASPWVMDNRIVILCSNLHVTGAIDTSYKGYQGSTSPTGYGPGGGIPGGSGTPAFGAGAGHGGLGGAPYYYNNKGGIGGPSYGSLTYPSEPGSAGGACWGSGLPISGSGGGAVWIEASGTVRVDGVIRADGEDREPGGGARGGPGSGGSVYIDCHLFAGSASGAISASGNRVNASNCGGGAGGRIAVHFDEVEAGTQVAFDAEGGRGYSDGAEGTVYLSSEAPLRTGIDGTHGYIYNVTGLVVSSLAISDSTLWLTHTGFVLTVTNDLVMGPDALMSLDISNGTVAVGGDLTLGDGSLLQLTGGPTNSTGIYTNFGAFLDVGGALTVGTNCTLSLLGDMVNGGVPRVTAQNVIVHDSGLLTATAGGYGGGPSAPSYGLGPGPGRGSTATYAGGGGYGGEGGYGANNNASYGGDPYGSSTEPRDPGSGGGTTSGGRYGTRGGGVVWIEAASEVTVNGTIAAEGELSTRAATGSGGGIYVMTEVLSGTTGHFSAEGGDSGWGHGPGGGGRIALHYYTDLFAGTLSVDNGYSVNSPTLKTAYSAQDGTIHRAQRPGVLTVTVAADPAQHGTPSPFAYGDWGMAPGRVVTNAIDSPADTAGGERYVCTGWTLLDDTNGWVSGGSTTQATFTVSTNLTQTWVWTNQYYLTSGALVGGELTADRTGWYTNGVVVSIEATPTNASFTFAQWAGDVPVSQLTNNPLALTIDEARDVTAVFVSDTPTTRHWTGTGDWFADWTNWAPQGVPGPNDTLFVDSGTVRLGTGTEVDAITVQGGVLQVAGGPSLVGLTLAGSMVITGATSMVDISNTVLSVAGDLSCVSGGDLTVRGGPTNGAAYGALVDVAGAMTLASGSWVYPYSHPFNGGSPKFEVSSLTVPNGAGFDASSKGYASGFRYYDEVFGWLPQRGNGPGGGGVNPALYLGYTAGGGYGGEGGDSAYSSSAGGVTYGSESYPVQCGSGGGGPNTTDRAGYGGGLIWIEAAGSVTLDGTLNADGESRDGSQGGGGSGGGVNVDVMGAMTVSATGVVTADGGGGGFGSGGGGGGRIALRSRGGLFRGSLSVDYALGHNGLNRYGAQPGTIFFKMPVGTLLLIK